MLFGGAGGNDVMLGGAGADVFIFQTGGGTERINDWQDGVDLMDVSGIGAVTGFGDLTITQSGPSTTILADDVTIILTGFLGTLDASDFDFTV